jgi:uncharacterized OB-fold protein
MEEITTRPFTAASFEKWIGEHRLMGSHCPECNRLYLPPRAICPHCHAHRMEWVELSGEGRLAAFTSVYIGPTFMNAAGYSRTNPYVTGIVELDEGVKISARILEVDARHPETIQVGMPVSLSFIEQGEGEATRTILAFRPCWPADSRPVTHA